MTRLNTYLNVVGFTNKVNTDFETLYELHRLHTLRFPFENITPFLHDKVSLEYEDVSRKFLDKSRGGYCFEQNLLFTEILKEIGFKVRPLGARVLWNQTYDLISRRSHMLEIVTVGTEEYLCDVGFGGLTLPTPIKFLTGVEQKTTHENYRISPLENDLKLEAMVEGGWKTLYRFDLTLHYPVDYEVANFYLYTHPESIFRNKLIASKLVSDGRYSFLNNQLSFYPLNGFPDKKVLNSPEEIRSVMKDVFSLSLPDTELVNSKLKAFLV
jgi:N-hydroxyarylamine O-acetyltransferase